MAKPIKFKATYTHDLGVLFKFLQFYKLGKTQYSNKTWITVLDLVNSVINAI